VSVSCVALQGKYEFGRKVVNEEIDQCKCMKNVESRKNGAL
jgi:hypothetical protein